MKIPAHSGEPSSASSRRRLAKSEASESALSDRFAEPGPSSVPGTAASDLPKTASSDCGKSKELPCASLEAWALDVMSLSLLLLLLLS
eukprot:CAMPEP_0115097048 /NCGR_PEP_ID=MMETSP0227-20121206/30176_1 /TAXON_ID=89957 /ORGANISM="Polarella glacialis, Strain CCMP 1383" /LENGTH=87 /DNA_ID=CAMNT_0002491077 /DNA_START=28 /DNA_END=288 /DNA_ORIENTATION=-